MRAMRLLMGWFIGGGGHRGQVIVQVADGAPGRVRAWLYSSGPPWRSGARGARPRRPRATRRSPRRAGGTAPPQDAAGVIVNVLPDWRALPRADPSSTKPESAPSRLCQRAWAASKSWTWKRMNMTSVLSPSPGIDPRMPIESGWPTVSQTFRRPQALVAQYRVTLAGGGAGRSHGHEQGDHAERCAQRGHTLTIPSAPRGFRCL